MARSTVLSDGQSDLVDQNLAGRASQECPAFSLYTPYSSDLATFPNKMAKLQSGCYSKNSCAIMMDDPGCIPSENNDDSGEEWAVEPASSTMGGFPFCLVGVGGSLENRTQQTDRRMTYPRRKRCWHQWMWLFLVVSLMVTGCSSGGEVAAESAVQAPVSDGYRCWDKTHFELGAGSEAVVRVEGRGVETIPLRGRVVVCGLDEECRYGNCLVRFRRFRLQSTEGWVGTFGDEEISDLFVRVSTIQPGLTFFGELDEEGRVEIPVGAVRLRINFQLDGEPASFVGVNRFSELHLAPGESDGEWDLTVERADTAKFDASMEVEITNRPPLADAGGDRTVECEDGEANAITFDASGTRNRDSDELRYVWRAEADMDGETTREGEEVTFLLPVGTHEVELAVSDVRSATVDKAVVECRPVSE